MSTFDENVNLINQYNASKLNGEGAESLFGSSSPAEDKASNKKKVFIGFEKEQFVATNEALITTTINLSRKIANKLNVHFCDLAGVMITPGQKGIPECVLYFVDRPAKAGDTRIKGMVKIAEEIKRNASSENESPLLSQIIATTESRKRNKVYSLSKEAREGLERFMYRDRNGRINWNQRENEIYSTPIDLPGSGKILLQLSGIDLNALLGAIYGNKYKTKDESGAECVNYIKYQAQVLMPTMSPYAPIGQMMTDYALLVNRLDSTEFNKVKAMLGRSDSFGSIPMATPDRY